MPDKMKQLPPQTTDFVQNTARRKMINLFQGTDQYPDYFSV